ncbi:hypothetical protein H257_11068 [Aphanomyces astaci]|uniref:Uncharacterized protein n=1 Tax=Aphanomyces astaci TaxID=112090 RepID=W4G4G3_APHAT|nr:hypothetical protein H257_11068 [Aphanomyces astaci]ETV74550.1 hypothetical protein H257_11068 [Aphanomyces astaci]|eukprot:XP_009836208.1 hypothetical protein H257_11068 [Aphanomyces astaci]
MTQGRLDLTNMVREAILREVLLKCQDGVVCRLPRGFGNDLATKYGCHVSSVRRIIAREKAQDIASGNMQVCVANRKKRRVGRKIKYTAAQAREKLLQVPLRERTSLRSISAKTGEKPPERKCKSKRFITKVMFLTAVARPRLNEDTGVWWDGKIGTWPFVKQAAALRSSVNREAGTIETKVISVTKDVYREYLLGKHDNARTHVTTSDAKLQESFRQYAAQAWFLAPQPANSPNLNVLDLGFFAALQSLQHRESARTIDDLVANVAKGFKDYPFERLDHTFMTLQSCLLETIRVGGFKDYPFERLDHTFMTFRTWESSPTEDYRDGTAKLSAIDAVAYERAVETELDELPTADELSTFLESMALDSEVTAALEAAGLEAIEL